jgi:cytochrome oxidase Cu insertion factor (SCO1/SenC/PrrC family)
MRVGIIETMRSVAIKCTLLLVAAGLALSACGTQVGPTRSDGTSSGSGRGGDDRSLEPAPDFTVETFDGHSFTLSEQRGTPVVLNFWESW